MIDGERIAAKVTKPEHTDRPLDKQTSTPAAAPIIAAATHSESEL